MRAQPEVQTDYIWWEFRLRDSFRWRALECGLPHSLWQERMVLLADALGLAPWLDLPGEELPPAVRDLANRALALLPEPVMSHSHEAHVFRLDRRTRRGWTR